MRLRWLFIFPRWHWQSVFFSCCMQMAAAIPDIPNRCNSVKERGISYHEYPFIGKGKADQMVENLPAMLETWVWSLGQEDSLQKGMATYSSIFAWIPWTEGPGSLQSQGHKDSDTTEQLTLSLQQTTFRPHWLEWIGPEDRNETTENDVDEGWLVPRHRGEWRTGTDFVGGVCLENEVGVG